MNRPPRKLLAACIAMGVVSVFAAAVNSPPVASPLQRRRRLLTYVPGGRSTRRDARRPGAL